MIVEHGRHVYACPPCLFRGLAGQLAQQLEHSAIKQFANGGTRSGHAVLGDADAQGSVGWTFANDAVAGGHDAVADGLALASGCLTQ